MPRRFFCLLLALLCCFGAARAGDETAVFTASETDGDGNTFAGWIGDIPSGVFDARRSIPIVANADKSITALYHHAWTIDSISGGVTNITDGAAIAEKRFATSFSVNETTTL